MNQTANQNSRSNKVQRKKTNKQKQKRINLVTSDLSFARFRFRFGKTSYRAQQRRN